MSSHPVGETLKVYFFFILMISLALDRVVKENSEFTSSQQSDNIHISYKLVLEHLPFIFV
jgi:hypothetical protein